VKDAFRHLPLFLLTLGKHRHTCPVHVLRQSGLSSFSPMFDGTSFHPVVAVCPSSSVCEPNSVSESPKVITPTLYLTGILQPMDPPLSCFVRFPLFSFSTPPPLSSPFHNLQSERHFFHRPFQFLAALFSFPLVGSGFWYRRILFPNSPAELSNSKVFPTLVALIFKVHFSFLSHSRDTALQSLQTRCDSFYDQRCLTLSYPHPSHPIQSKRLCSSCPLILLTDSHIGPTRPRVLGI